MGRKKLSCARLLLCKGRRRCGQNDTLGQMMGAGEMELSGKKKFEGEKVMFKSEYDIILALKIYEHTQILGEPSVSYTQMCEEFLQLNAFCETDPLYLKRKVSNAFDCLNDFTIIDMQWTKNDLGEWRPCYYLDEMAIPLIARLYDKHRAKTFEAMSVKEHIILDKVVNRESFNMFKGDEEERTTRTKTILSLAAKELITINTIEGLGAVPTATTFGALINNDFINGSGFTGRDRAPQKE